MFQINQPPIVWLMLSVEFPRELETFFNNVFRSESPQCYTYSWRGEEEGDKENRWIGFIASFTLLEYVMSFLASPEPGFISTWCLYFSALGVIFCNCFSSSISRTCSFLMAQNGGEDGNAVEVRPKRKIKNHVFSFSSIITFHKSESILL